MRKLGLEATVPLVDGLGDGAADEGIAGGAVGVGRDVVEVVVESVSPVVVVVERVVVGATVVVGDSVVVESVEVTGLVVVGVSVVTGDVGESVVDVGALAVVAVELGTTNGERAGGGVVSTFGRQRSDAYQPQSSPTPAPHARFGACSPQSEERRLQRDRGVRPTSKSATIPGKLS